MIICTSPLTLFACPTFYPAMLLLFTVITFLLCTARAELDTQDVSTNIDAFINLIKMCDDCENNITVFDKGKFITKLLLLYFSRVNTIF